MKLSDWKHLHVPERYEVLDGEPVELPYDSLASEVANEILRALTLDPGMDASGRARMAMMYHLPHPTDSYRCRRPSVAWTSFDRFPDDRPISYDAIAVEVVPELVVEVLTWNDTADDLLVNATEYLTAGAMIVWLILPRAASAVVCEPGQSPRTVEAGGKLDGGRAFPDLRVPMAGLFPPVA